MSDKTDIQWTDATWNPIRGCSRVSRGCEQCYAEGVAARFSGPGLPFEGLARRTEKGLPQWTGEVRMIADKLDLPLRWKRPRKVFVNSVSDLFHEKLSDEQIAAVFGVMAAAPQHTFQVLTKRPARMRRWFDWIAREKISVNARRGAPAPFICLHHAQRVSEHRALRVDTDRIIGRPWPLPNVWLGVSAENQETADERILLLFDAPAAVRWVSAEPLLGPVDLRLDGRGMPIDWLVVGGESGLRARPFDPAWARALVQQTREAGCPIFVKQMGRRPVGLELADSHGGDWDKWPEDLRVRQFPKGTT